MLAKLGNRLMSEDGNLEVTFEVSYFTEKEKFKALEKGELYDISAVKYRPVRSAEQNRMMWALIHDIAVERGGERAVNDDWDIYVEAIERAGAKFRLYDVLDDDELIKALEKGFRAVKRLNTFVDDIGQKRVTLKCFFGSSKMNKKEMGLLLETVLDMAEESGVTIPYEFNYQQ